MVQRLPLLPLLPLSLLLSWPTRKSSSTACFSLPVMLSLPCDCRRCCCCFSDGCGCGTSCCAAVSITSLAAGLGNLHQHKAGHTRQRSMAYIAGCHLEQSSSCQAKLQGSLALFPPAVAGEPLQAPQARPDHTLASR